MLWPNGWIDQCEIWHAGGPRPWQHCVRWEPSSPFPNRGRSHQFSAHICCSQVAGWIKMPVGREIGLSLNDIVLGGDQLPSPKRGRSPEFSAHVYCGQMAGRIQMPLGTEVGLSHCVRWGPSSPLPKGGGAHGDLPLPKGAQPPFFGQYLLWPNGWMDQDAREVGLSPGDIV